LTSLVPILVSSALKRRKEKEEKKEKKIKCEGRDQKSKSTLSFLFS
jgi:hypothetical protein